jgi:hypothetical protein
MIRVSAWKGHFEASWSETNHRPAYNEKNTPHAYSYTSLTFNCTGAFIFPKSSHTRLSTYLFVFSAPVRTVFVVVVITHDRRFLMGCQSATAVCCEEFNITRIHQSNFETIITLVEQLITLWFMITLTANEHFDCVSTQMFVHVYVYIPPERILTVIYRYYNNVWIPRLRSAINNKFSNNISGKDQKNSRSWRILNVHTAVVVITFYCYITYMYRKH